MLKGVKNDWNINCILPHYRDQDYRKIKNNIHPRTFKTAQNTQ